MRIGYFGSSTGAAAAFHAAAKLKGQIGAIVSRGGRVDLAGATVSHIVSPTLFIVGQHDMAVLKLNDDAFAQFKCEKAMEIIPGATQLFEEPGKLELVAEHALGWFRRYLVPT
jgi:pimeloyl-ACP methyl ester carboxylesterase